MSHEIRPGFYLDVNGEWQVERRLVAVDRRHTHSTFPHHDRRTAGRRKADHEFVERDHKQMIEDALQDFAAEHEHK